MKGVFHASHRIANLSTADTLLLYLVAPAFEGVKLLYASVTCEEEVNQQIRVSLQRASGPATGTPVTPVPTDFYNSIPGSTLIGGPFTVTPTLGVTAFEEAANALGGWYYAPGGPTIISVPAGGGIAIKMVKEPSAAIFLMTMAWLEGN